MDVQQVSFVKNEQFKATRYRRYTLAGALARVCTGYVVHTGALSLLIFIDSLPVYRAQLDSACGGIACGIGQPFLLSDRSHYMQSSNPLHSLILYCWFGCWQGL